MQSYSQKDSIHKLKTKDLQLKYLDERPRELKTGHNNFAAEKRLVGLTAWFLAQGYHIDAMKS